MVMIVWLVPMLSQDTCPHNQVGRQSQMRAGTSVGSLWGVRACGEKEQGKRQLVGGEREMNGVWCEGSRVS